MASRGEGPCWVDRRNQLDLVDSVNWSHSDWANLSAEPFVSDICRVSHQPQRPAWYQGRKMITAEMTAYSASLLILRLSVYCTISLFFIVGKEIQECR